MPHPATALAHPVDPHGGSLVAPTVETAIAAVVEAGRTIAELRAQLAAAERIIADLTEEKRALRAELRAVSHGFTPRLPAAPLATLPPLNRRDEAIAVILDGLGPLLVRPARD